MTVDLDAICLRPVFERLGEPAIWRAGGAGAGVTVTAIPKQPDETLDALADTTLRQARNWFDVRAAEVATPAKGDTLTVAGVVYDVVDATAEDARRLVFTLACRPA